MPPGHAGRAWAELPPGIRKKVPKPVAPAPAAVTAPESTSTKAAATTSTAAATSTTATVAPSKPADPAVSDAQMERYLAELNAGRADRTKEPTGFMSWVRAQLQRERTSAG